MTRSVSYFLEQGHWFLSLYNDDMDAQEVSFVVRVSQELTQNCPQGCNGRGQCVLGRCQCEAGYDGPDCGQSKSIVTNKMAALKCHLCLLGPKGQNQRFFKLLYFSLEMFCSLKGMIF